MRPLLLALAAAVASTTTTTTTASATLLTKAPPPHDDSDIKALAAWDENTEAVAANIKTLPERMKTAILKNGEGSEWIGTQALGPLPLPSPVPAYTQHGPCTYAPAIKGLLPAAKIGAGAKNGTEDVLVPELTLPLNCSGASGRTAPWPVIFFYDGFSVPSYFYESYHKHFASWGYAVVTYGHATGLDLIPDSVEVNYSPPVLDWAIAQAAKAGTALNTTSIGVTGHSMGGKLAALQWCSAVGGMPSIAAAVLISPVGHTLVSPPSTLTPSGPACMAAASAKGPVALVDGAVRGNCNPPGVESSYRSWAASTAPGSWNAYVYHAGHSDFVDVKPAWQAAAEAICFPGKGDADAAATTAFTAGQATAWFDWRMASPDLAAPGMRDAFLAWAAQQSAWMEWVVKSSPAPGR